MTVAANAPWLARPAPKLLAGMLALAVHVAFILLLVFGVSWQTEHPVPVSVDIWASLPPPPRTVPPEPEPVRRAPPPPPVERAEPDPPSPRAPDIALEKARQREQLAAQQRAELKERENAARAENEALEKIRDKQLDEERQRALLRQIEQDELKQRMADETAAQSARQQQAAAQAAAIRRQSEVSRVVGQYRDQISAKVRGNTRLPDNLQGNPEVRCRVRLLPTGEVQSVRVIQSSGNPAYDEAVVRAIEKSSPLPLPAERDARAAFVPELNFVHRPKE